MMPDDEETLPSADMQSHAVAMEMEAFTRNEPGRNGDDEDASVLALEKEDEDNNEAPQEQEEQRGETTIIGEQILSDVLEKTTEAEKEEVVVVAAEDENSEKETKKKKREGSMTPSCVSSTPNEATSKAMACGENSMLEAANLLRRDGGSERQTESVVVPCKKLRFNESGEKVAIRKRRKFVAPPRIALKTIDQNIIVPVPPPSLVDDCDNKNEEEEEMTEEEPVVVKTAKVMMVKKKRRFCVPMKPGFAKIEYLPHEPLILERGVPVPKVVCQFLRPHQREGVQFLYDCLSGKVEYADKVQRFGAILADDMGLGKTLQTLTFIYALLQAKQAHRILVACPCSLVGNWANEFDKWINSKVASKRERVEVRAITEGVKVLTERAIDQFLSPTKPFDVLILSYDSLRINVDRFPKNIKMIDVLVADEAQRLKGAKTQLNLALRHLDCPKRILLTGTPLQNDLDEFRALADVAMPPQEDVDDDAKRTKGGVFGTEQEFRKHFVLPVEAAREPDADEREKKLGLERQAELADIARKFVLRRENTLNAVHLPPKLTQVLCCRMPEKQQNAYRAVLDDKQLQHALAGKQTDVLVYINKLKQICNHPDLIYSDNTSQKKKFFHEKDSGKMLVLFRLMRAMRKRHDGERIVIVANLTSVLEVVSQLCDREGWPWCILDGSTPTNKRKELNESFNDPASHHFAFLLSSTAGGCGLNLIGANRLVLFDQSWNPATDKQAAARCWRDGNKRNNYVYRLVTTGTIEEKIYQRQLQKEGLKGVVEDKDQLVAFAADDLKKLFAPSEDTRTSDTHEKLGCDCCRSSSLPMVAPSAATGTVNDLCCPERLALCQRYLLVLQGEAPPTLRVAFGARLDALAEKLGNPDLATLPQLRREIDKAVDAVNPKTPSSTPADDETNFKSHVDASWRDFVPKVTAIRGGDTPTKGTNDDEAVVDFCKPQLGLPAEEDLANWSHHSSVATVDDEVLRTALKGKYKNIVTFVFGLQVSAQLIKEFSAPPL